MLLDHEAEDDIAQTLSVSHLADVGLAADVAAVGVTEDAAVLRSLGLHGLDGLTDLIAGLVVSKHDGLEAGADSLLSKVAAGLEVDLDHGAHVKELGSTAHILEVVLGEGGILSDELHVVKLAGGTEGLSVESPGAPETGADRGLALVKKLSEFVFFHCHIHYLFQ